LKDMLKVSKEGIFTPYSSTRVALFGVQHDKEGMIGFYREETPRSQDTVLVKACLPIHAYQDECKRDSGTGRLFHDQEVPLSR
jgi:hypothetical protein